MSLSIPSALSAGKDTVGGVGTDTWCLLNFWRAEEQLLFHGAASRTEIHTRTFSR